MGFQDEFFRSVLDSFSDGVYFVDRERRITYWNRAAERITGYLAEDVVGSHCYDEILVHVDDSGKHLCHDGCPVAATIVDRAIREADVYLHHRDGHRVPVKVRVAPLVNPEGELIGAVEAFSDNSAQMSALQRIQELEKAAYLDTLTGLANRAFTEIELNSRLEEMRRYGWPFGVLFLDVDRFKSINDRFGHEVGDQALRVVARTLASNARSFDLVGRWGGEEFVAILVNVDRERLAALAERTRLLVEGSSVALQSGETLQVTVSIGAAPARPDDTAESLIARADALMYASKSAGRNRVTLEPPP
ncbi:MAG: sensor domain-containing diguanylate cyclase [Acidobacteriota bacterium]